MKKLIAVSLSGIFAAGLYAQTTTEELLADISVTTTFAYESEYIFRGFKLAQQSFQPSVEVGYMGGYAGIWTNQPINATGDDDDPMIFENEIDFYGGYAFEIPDSGFTVDVGATVYYYPEAPSDADETTFEIYVGGSYDLGNAGVEGLGVSGYLYYDFDLEAFTAELSGSYSYPLTDAASLDVGAYLGWVSPDEGDEVFYYGATADVGYTINDAVSASAGVRYAGNDGDSENDSFLWWGASVTAGF